MRRERNTGKILMISLYPCKRHYIIAQYYYCHKYIICTEMPNASHKWVDGIYRVLWLEIKGEFKALKDKLRNQKSLTFPVLYIKLESE